MQIGGKWLKKFVHQYGVEKKALKKQKFNKTRFHASLLENELKNSNFEIVQLTTIIYEN